MPQSELKKFFNNKVEVSSKTFEADNFGGKSLTWSTSETKVDCRIYDVKGEYEITLEGQSYPASSQLICDASADISRGDKVKDDNNENFYLVLSVKKIARISNTHHLECDLARVDRL